MNDGQAKRRGGRPWRPLPEGQPELNALISWLRERLDQHGRTLRDLTGPLKRGKDTISRALNGDRRPEWEFVVALLRACAPHDPKASERLIAKAKPLWDAADAGARKAPLPITRNTVEALRAEVELADARRLRAQSAVHVHQAIVNRLLWLLNGLVSAIDTLATRHAELRVRAEAERADRRAAQEALTKALDLDARVTEAQHRLPRVEEQLNEAHLQLARSNRILQDAIGHHLRLHRQLLELGGAAARREVAAAPVTADDHELMGEFDQDVADAVLAGSRAALEGAAAELDDLVGAPHGRVLYPMRLSPRTLLLAGLNGDDSDPRRCVLRLVDALVLDTPHDGPADSPVSIDITRRRGAGGTPDAVVVRARGQRIASAGFPSVMGSTRGPGSGDHRRAAFGAHLYAAALPLGRRLTMGAALGGRWTELTLDLTELDADSPFSSSRRTPDPGRADDVEITIDDLGHDARRVLGEPGVIARLIADVYSHALREGHLRVTVDGRPVHPRRPCAWNPTRTVPRPDREAAAVQHLDFVLPLDSPEAVTEGHAGRIQPAAAATGRTPARSVAS
ncbi:hypothetical protein ACWEFJ_30290 [Actinosynnema sp. NPDC004786]